MDVRDEEKKDCEGIGSPFRTPIRSNIQREVRDDSNNKKQEQKQQQQQQPLINIVDGDDDTTEGSFGGDYLGTFQAYLRGEESAEKVQRRVLLTKQERRIARMKDVAANKAKKKQQIVSKWWICIRTICIDIPLIVLFASFLFAWFIQNVHDKYYVPLFYRARRTDDDLLEEYTYYERQCTEYDLSTRNIHDMLVNTSSSSNVIPTAVEQMMTHGGTVIPNVLQTETVIALREYIVNKNARITDAEAYPMSQGEYRLSYGIDASEDIIVSKAISEVANHTIIRPLLASLLGDVNPASAEITAITSYPGAEDQVWHQDTKQDGNAIKFARTYSHSYSLFMPLQDTTARMGITDICPGTHYCTNDLEAMCEKTKMGLHLAGENDIFPAGAGALLNQHVWHRGGAHTDPRAPERIVFILSFLARPNFNTDPRQLSRGTYFHQKWNMWGHTWTDLLDPINKMKYPFSLLRCLSLWKPYDSSWGYDLITSGFMRFSNEQLEYEDFEYRFLPRLDQLHFPNFLRGRYIPNTMQFITWSVFIKETIDNIFTFMAKINIIAHGVYMGIVILVAITTAIIKRQLSSFRMVKKSISRLFMTHGLLFLIGIAIWINVKESKWGQSISSGRALMRPFPPPNNNNTSFVKLKTVSTGLTTIPIRYDVLIGSRFDAKFLGSYDRWLDYHPGNVAFRYLIAKNAAEYKAVKNINPSLRVKIIDGIVSDLVTGSKGGRFLQQDYRNGDWRIMNTNEIYEVIHVALLCKANTYIAYIRKRLDWMIAEHRFGYMREKSIIKFSHLLLWNIKRQIMFSMDPVLSVPNNINSNNNNAGIMHKNQVIKALPSVLSSSKKLSYQHHRSLLPIEEQQKKKDNDDEFVEGTLVWVYYQDDEAWYPGTILDRYYNNEWYTISFEDSSWEDNIHVSQLRKYIPIVEGDTVEGCYEHGLIDCYSGIITRVMPGGYISIQYNDGDIDTFVPPSRYYVPPFIYEGPFFY